MLHVLLLFHFVVLIICVPVIKATNDSSNIPGISPASLRDDGIPGRRDGGGGRGGGEGGGGKKRIGKEEVEEK